MVEKRLLVGGWYNNLLSKRMEELPEEEECDTAWYNRAMIG